MISSHPFEWLSHLHQAILLVLLALATISLMAVLARQGRALETDAAPHGILSLEFAWTPHRAEAIRESWKNAHPKLMDTARQQLRLDFAFLLVYPLLLSLAGAMLADPRGSSLAVAGLFTSWLVLAAAPLDALENISLLRVLHRGPTPFLTRLAWWCAVLKFSLIFAALGSIVLQGMILLGAKLRGA